MPFDNVEFGPWIHNGITISHRGKNAKIALNEYGMSETCSYSALLLEHHFTKCS